MLTSNCRVVTCRAVWNVCTNLTGCLLLPQYWRFMGGTKKKRKPPFASLPYSCAHYASGRSRVVCALAPSLLRVGCPVGVFWWVKPPERCSQSGPLLTSLLCSAVMRGTAGWKPELVSVPASAMCQLFSVHRFRFPEPSWGGWSWEKWSDLP